MNRFQRITRIMLRFLTFLTGISILMAFSLRARAASPPISPSTSASVAGMQVSHSDEVSTTSSNPVNYGNPVNDGNDLSNSNVVSNVVSDAEISIPDSDRSDDSLRTRPNPADSCYNSLPTSGSEASLATQEDEAGWNGNLVDLTIDDHYTKKESMARKGRRLIDRFELPANQQHRHFIRKDSTVNILMGKYIEDCIIDEEVRVSQYMQNGVFGGGPLEVNESMLKAVRIWHTTYRDGNDLLNPPNPPN